MKITLTPTSDVGKTEINGQLVPGRVWEGQDERGVPILAFIARVAVHVDQPDEVHARFGEELQECEKEPPSGRAFDIRLFVD